MAKRVGLLQKLLVISGHGYIKYGLLSAILLCTFILFISVSTKTIARPQRAIHFHKLQLSVESEEMKLTLKNENEEDLLKAKLGTTLSQYKVYQVTMDERTLVVAFQEHALLTIEFELFKGCSLYHVTWEAGYDITVLEDDIIMADAHWYGATTVHKQLWPNEKWNRAPAPFVAGDSFKDYWGGVQERYWLSSKGVSLFVEYSVPLFVGMNYGENGLLQFIAKFSRPFRNQNNAKLSLKYTISSGRDLKHVHDIAPGKFWQKPSSIPDKRIFRHPIWSTWAHFKKAINHTVIINYAKEIKKRGFKCAQLEIDDDWSTRYGDYEFDSNKFPNPRQTVDELKFMGFRVTLWVQPFASIFSNALYLKDTEGHTMHVTWPYMTFPALTIWWDGLGATLDLTNPNVVDYWLSELHRLRMDYGIDSFKFDAGECSWLPGLRDTYLPLDNPNEYTRKFVEIAHLSDTDIKCQEVRVGVRSQQLPMFIRLMDKDSHWEYSNGLKSLIPQTLTHGLIGFPFVLPDMIGGNAYNGIFISLTAWPDRELYIRWLQASTLLPAMQFSVVPWHYDDEVSDLARRMCALHEQYSDIIINLAEESRHTGAPIIRPLWWTDPTDLTSQVVDTEFLLGNNILVAPVLDEGARSRDVYLPRGQWKDLLRSETYSGRQWVKDFKADLSELPIFERVTDRT